MRLIVETLPISPVCTWFNHVELSLTVIKLSVTKSCSPWTNENLEVLSGLVVSKFGILAQTVTSVGSSPTSGNAENLSQYDPGYGTGRNKTPSLTLSMRIFDSEAKYCGLMIG